MLGQGNFGKVCLATVSHAQIRDEDQANKDLANFINNIGDSSSGGADGRRMSLRRQNIYKGNKDDEDENKQLLLPRDARKVAVKMVKGLLLFSFLSITIISR